MDLSDPSNLWEYLPGFEPPEAYDLFTWFRDCAPILRSFADTHRAFPHVSYSTIVRYAREGMWLDRCAAYDQHRAQARDQARQAYDKSADISWAEQRAGILARAREIVETAQVQLLQDLRSGRHMRPNEVKAATDMLLKFGNLENGDATERVDVGPDLSHMSSEERDQFRALLNKAKTNDDGEDEQE